jgi:hypothetical protein
MVLACRLAGHKEVIVALLQRHLTLNSSSKVSCMQGIHQTNKAWLSCAAAQLDCTGLLRKPIGSQLVSSSVLISALVSVIVNFITHVQGYLITMLACAFATFAFAPGTLTLTINTWHVTPFGVAGVKC